MLCSMTKPRPKGLNNTIIEHRYEKRLSQEELAAALGISRSTLWAIERGRAPASLTMAIRIARYFGKTVEEMFHLEGDPEPTPEKLKMVKLLQHKPGTRRR